MDIKLRYEDAFIKEMKRYDLQYEDVERLVYRKLESYEKYNHQYGTYAFDMFEGGYGIKGIEIYRDEVYKVHFLKIFRQEIDGVKRRSLEEIKGLKDSELTLYEYSLLEREGMRKSVREWFDENY